MIKDIVLAVLLIALTLSLSMNSFEEEPYEQNKMVDGCVMQKVGAIWVRTCG